jgi:hypothetical protein
VVAFAFGVQQTEQLVLLVHPPGEGARVETVAESLLDTVGACALVGQERLGPLDNHSCYDCRETIVESFQGHNTEKARLDAHFGALEWAVPFQTAS